MYILAEMIYTNYNHRIIMGKRRKKEIYQEVLTN